MLYTVSNKYTIDSRYSSNSKIVNKVYLKSFINPIQIKPFALPSRQREEVVLSPPYFISETCIVVPRFCTPWNKHHPWIGNHPNTALLNRCPFQISTQPFSKLSPLNEQQILWSSETDNNWKSHVNFSIRSAHIW